MDHDSLFKALLITFFVDFVNAFLPDMAEYLDPTSIEFIDKELFTDVTAREKHEVDLLVKTRFREKDAFFLIHVENQATPEPNFPKRMFRYFARLHEKYDLPIYPVALFSFDKPLREESDHYEVVFPNKTVLRFEYTTIQLNRLPWRSFITKLNPVVTALLVKMNIEPRDRPRVLMECARMLATLKLDPARAELIWTFADSYLKLTAEEMRQYEREVAKLAPDEKEATMQLMSTIRREGMQEGLEQGMQQGMHEGKVALVSRQIVRRFGPAPPQIAKGLELLTSDELDGLGEDLLDFKSLDDLAGWLSNHRTVD